MQLTESFYMKRTKENKEQFDQLDKWLRVANNLYNQALYLVKKAYEDEGKFLSYFDLDKLMKEVKNLDGEINYMKMPSASSAQQILRLLGTSINAFFQSLKDWKKNPKKYKGKPAFPKFRKKGIRFMLQFSGWHSKIRNRKFCLTRNFHLKIPKNSQSFDPKDLDCVRILPATRDRIKIEMVYTVEEAELKEDNGRVLGIDLGLNNFATCVTNAEFRPFILNGRELKSYNQNYNKRKAKLKSLLPKGRYNSRQLEELEFRRYCYIQDVFHTYSARIIQFCLDHNINTIVIGHNKDWKQGINLGKKNNQNFVSIPYYRFIQMLKYKCKLYGLNFVETEESYTSKIDHLANEPMQHRDSYLGKRVRRGLFRSSIKRLINADVNGAIGIIRKVFGNSPVMEIADKGLLYRPVRIGFGRIKKNLIYIVQFTLDGMNCIFSST